jgi:hypothetical protein
MWIDQVRDEQNVGEHAGTMWRARIENTVEDSILETAHGKSDISIG